MKCVRRKFKKIFNAYFQRKNVNTNNCNRKKFKSLIQGWEQINGFKN